MDADIPKLPSLLNLLNKPTYIDISPIPNIENFSLLLNNSNKKIVNFFYKMRKYAKLCRNQIVVNI